MNPLKDRWISAAVPLCDSIIYSWWIELGSPLQLNLPHLDQSTITPVSHNIGTSDSQVTDILRQDRLELAKFAMFVFKVGVCVESNFRSNPKGHALNSITPPIHLYLLFI